jgi:glutaredoxin
MAKDYLSEKGIAFEDHNVAEDLEKRQEMMEKVKDMGHIGVPVIIIGEEVIIGFDKTRIDQLLGL